jgi:hypothetical protein
VLLIAADVLAVGLHASQYWIKDSGRPWSSFADGGERPADWELTELKKVLAIEVLET